MMGDLERHAVTTHMAMGLNNTNRYLNQMGIAHSL